MPFFYGLNYILLNCLITIFIAIENGAGTLVKILTPVSLCISVMALCVCVYVCASQDTNKPLPWVIPISPEGFEAMQPLTATPAKTVCGGWSWFSSLGSLAVRKVYTQVQAGTHTHTHAHRNTVSFHWWHTLFPRLLPAAPTHIRALALNVMGALCMSGLHPNTATVATCCNYYQMDQRKTH